MVKCVLLSNKMTNSSSGCRGQHAICLANSPLVSMDSLLFLEMLLLLRITSIQFSSRWHSPSRCLKSLASYWTFFIVLLCRTSWVLSVRRGEMSYGWKRLLGQVSWIEKRRWGGWFECTKHSGWSGLMGSSEILQKSYSIIKHIHFPKYCHPQDVSPCRLDKVNPCKSILSGLDCCLAQTKIQPRSIHLSIATKFQQSFHIMLSWSKRSNVS